MYVVSSVMRGARRLGHADPALICNFLSPGLLHPSWSAAPLLTCQQNRKYASKQVNVSSVNVMAWMTGSFICSM